MLRLVLVLGCSVVAISGFSLPSLFRRGSVVRGSERPCIEVASAITAVLDDEAKESPDISIKDIIQFASGVNPDDTALFQELVCQFVEETTESFVESLRQKGIERTLVRAFRSYEVASMEMSFQYIQPGTPVYNLMILALQSKYAKMDPENMVRMVEIVEHFFGQRPTVDVPQRSTPITCEDIKAALQPLKPYWRYYKPPHLSDEAFQELACNMLLTETIDELVQVIDAAGLPVIVVNYAKTVVKREGNEIPYLESILQDSENWGTNEELKEKRRLHLNVLYAFRDAGMID